jgi:hypothetical protein
MSFSKVDPELLARKKIPTKREVLRVVMSVFDPLGFLAPQIIPAKVLLQKIWKLGIGWDEKVPEQLFQEWNNWLIGLAEIEKCHINRCYSPLLSSADYVELHLFSDASEQAYGAVAYIRVVKDKEVQVSFVSAKSKVAPQKALSIPRLELQGALIASRLAKNLKNELPFEIYSTTYWVDSSTVLAWIRSDHRRYSSFVAHRVSEILDDSSISEWRWVPSLENVADDSTKWDTIPTLSRRWFEGPQFLSCNLENWPKERKSIESTDVEVKSIHNHHKIADSLFKIIPAFKFSKWSRLLNATAYVLRFRNNLKRVKIETGISTVRNKTLKAIIDDVPALTANELKEAETLLIKKGQSETFYNEIMTLKKEKQVSRGSSIYKLSPMLDCQEILRVNSRLITAPAVVNDDMRNPMLLGRNNWITHLIIDSVHRSLHH